MKLYHGGESEITKFVMQEDTPYYQNTLGYGVYLGDIDLAFRYKNPSVYEVDIQLNKELSIDEVTLSPKDITGIAELIYQEYNFEDIYNMIVDYSGDLGIDTDTSDELSDSLKKDITEDGIFDICEMIFTDKDIFDELCKQLGVGIARIFYTVGYTHAYTEEKGVSEWSVIPDAIVSVKDISEEVFHD